MLIFNHVKERQKFKRIFQLVSGETLQKIRGVPHGFISLLLFFPLHEPGMHKLSGCVIVCFPPSLPRPSDECLSIEHGGVSVHHHLLWNDQIKVDAIRWPCVATVVDVRSACRILVTKPEGEDSMLESLTSFKMYLKSLGCEDEDWV